MLYFVRHARPEIEEERAASSWRLREEGRVAARRSAESLPENAPIYCSTEPKAVETAEIIAAVTDAPVQRAENLGEHARETVDFLSADEFVERVRGVFRNPDEVVFGEESAHGALRRFGTCVERLAAGEDDAIVVAHGTVISLHVAELCEPVDPFRLWRRLGSPAIVAVDEAQGAVAEVVESVEEPEFEFEPFLRQAVDAGTAVELRKTRRAAADASSPRRRSRETGRLGEYLRVVRQPESARERLAEALELAEDAGSASLRAINLLRLAVAEQYSGRHHEALELHERALDAIRDAKRTDSHEDFAHQHRGKCLAELRRIDEARACFERALAIREQRGDEELMASTRSALEALA